MPRIRLVPALSLFPLLIAAGIAVAAGITGAAGASSAERPIVLAGIRPGADAGGGGENRESTGSPLLMAQPEGPLGLEAPSRSWPAAIGETFGTPMFYDLNGDGTMEVIAVDRQRTYVYSAAGVLLVGWPQVTGEVNNTPAVADIDEDGQPEIIVASSGTPPRIRCYRLNGTSIPGFPVSLPYQYWLNVTAPAVADVDGDGHLDVGAQSEPGVAFFDRFGRALPGWPYLWSTTQNIPWSAPAVGDLDGDGKNEVVVGTNDQYTPGVHVIRSNGTAKAGWPQPTRNIFASPAIADLDGDGDMEVVIQEGDPTWYGGRMHVWHHDGTYLPGWPLSISDDWEGSRSNPAIADLDGDGTLEIVTATGDARLHILRIDGTEFAGYPRVLPGGSISSAQVYDVDADGIEEIFLCYYATGSQWVGAWKLDGAVLAGFPKLLFAGSQLDAHGSVHIADLEGDGDLDLCAEGGTFGSGRVSVYEINGSTYQPGVTRADWPKIRRDAHNTGCYSREDPSAAPDGPGIAAWHRGARIVCSPNPVAFGGGLQLRIPGTGSGRLEAFDPLGRALGGVDAQGGTSFAIELNRLTGSRFTGNCFLRWRPQVRSPRAARVAKEDSISTARLTVLGH